MQNAPQQFRTRTNDRDGVPSGDRAVWVFKVKEVLPDQPNLRYLARCRTWDGTDEGPKDYIVRTQSKAILDREIIATKPEGGTGLEYGDPKKPVVWYEIAGGGDSLQYVECVDASQASSNGTVWVKVFRKTDNSLQGDQFTTEIQHYTEVGDRFWVITGRNGTLQLGLPDLRSNNMVLTINGQLGKWQGVDWDWLKLH